MPTRRCFAIFAVILALVLTACGGGGSSVTPPPPPPPPPPSPPSISTVAPATITLSAIPQGTIEVWGTNFNASAQAFIDGQPAIYTTLVNSGTLQLDVADSVTTTLGTHEVTVLQNTGTSNASPLTVYAPQIVPPVMNAIPSYLFGNETDPPSIVVRDVNGDGFADVLVPDWNNGQIYILNGHADGSLSAAPSLSVPQAYAVAVGDVDGNGTADLVAVSSDNAETSTVSVFLGDGHGNFQPVSSPQSFTGLFPGVIGLTDLDGDGQPDLVVYAEQDSASFNLVWFKNAGGGNFAPPISLALTTDNTVAIGDFNHDGKPDFIYGAVAGSASDSVPHLLMNQGGGKFTDQVAAGFNGIGGIPTVIDFNLDGIPDVVIEHLVNKVPSLYSFLGNGDGSFTQVSSVPIPFTYQFVTGDFDHDGFPDLAGSEILYLFGDGHGNFTPKQILGSGGSVIGTGDINGDGLPDIVASDFSDFVSVSLGVTNRNNLPAPLSLSVGSWGTVTVGDVNGDGLPEIVVGGVDDPEDGLSLPGTVFLNQGNGSFAFAANTDPRSFASEYLTGKGVVDLVGSNGNSLFIWPNNGTLSFSPSPITVQTSLPTGGVHIADMDGDGHPDIVTAGEVLFGNGAYQFTPLTLAISGDFAVGDFNGDGRLDIISGSTIFVNMGKRTFQAAATNLPFQTGFNAAVGDFNGDGKDDIVLSDGSPVFSIWYSRGDGTFYQGAILDPGQQTAAFETADFNGDGRVDLAIGLYLSNEVAMFFNQGGGIFTLSYFASGLSSYEMRTGDFNGNGKLDLVMEQYPPENPPVTVNVIFHK